MLREEELKTFVEGTTNYFEVAAQQPATIGSPYLMEGSPAVRILVISALADKATAVEAMEKGANGFLNKPFTDRQLNEAIAELMR